jgi:two-component system, chemotaxis family, chemotaxis protein CheY
MDFRNVLIIDDSLTSRLMLKECLSMAGIGVQSYHFAENGLDALELVKTSPVMDLILTDINMPKMDGITFVRKLRTDERYLNVPTVVVSTISDGKEELELRSFGIMGFIKKPISPEKVLAALEALP